MLGDIRKYEMNRLSDNRDNCDKWICDFDPQIRKKFYDNGDCGLEVEYKGDTYVIDSKKMTCPC